MFRIYRQHIAAKWLLGLVLALGTLMAAPQMVNAAQYRVSVTRVAQDAYRDTTSGLVVLTRYCYEYVYYQDAVLDYTAGMGGTLYFGRSSSCDVAGVAKPNAQLTRVRDNIYRDDMSGGYLRTSLCLSLALGEDALVLNDRVIFLSSHEECSRGL
jgi:hypothetical protein